MAGMKASEIAEQAGRAIREARRRKRMTQETVAELAGMSVRTLRRIERAAGDVPFTRLVRLGEILGYVVRVEAA